jgi:hypothetical protein
MAQSQVSNHLRLSKRYSAPANVSSAKVHRPTKLSVKFDTFELQTYFLVQQNGVRFSKVKKVNTTIDLQNRVRKASVYTCRIPLCQCHLGYHCFSRIQSFFPVKPGCPKFAPTGSTRTATSAATKTAATASTTGRSNVQHLPVLIHVFAK